MNNQPCEQLSPDGLVRREAMLDELVTVMTRTHRARRARRRILATAGCAGILLAAIRLAQPGAWVATDAPPIVDQAPPAPEVPMVPQTPETTRFATILVTTDPGVLQRCQARSSGRTVRIDDRTLLDALAAIDRPVGLVKVGDRMRFTAPVTDAELKDKQFNKRVREVPSLRLAGTPSDRRDYVQM